MTILKGIPSNISPALLRVLAEMGHGDELVISDANFPARTMGKRLVRADGDNAVDLLKAILTLFPLDTYVTAPAVVMQRVDKPTEDAPVYGEFQEALNKAEGHSVVMEKIERFAFYERAKKAFAVVSTGESRLYGNIIIKKGVIGTVSKDKEVPRSRL